MDNIKKCSIAGYSFAMTEEAYERMSCYIHSLENIYKDNEAKKEIIADIEVRIVELILSALSSIDDIVRLPLVENIIRQLGEAEQIGDESGESRARIESSIQRRLYRDMSHGKIGGVCAGIACYFRTDVVIIRMIMFLPLLLGIIMENIPCSGIISNIFINLWWTFILLYLIMWFSIPKARTARQKMEQNGEEITYRKIADGHAISENDRIENKTASTIGKLILAILKIILIIMAIPVLCIIMALLAIIIVTLCQITHPFELGNLSFLFNSDSIAITIITSLLALIPALIVLSFFLRLIFSSKPNRKAIAAGIIVWIILLVTDIVLICNQSFAWQSNEISRILRKDTAGRMEQLDSLEYNKLIHEPDAKNIDI